MTKRSKTTLFGLLALIAAFGLILTGCPDAAGSSSTEPGTTTVYEAVYLTPGSHGWAANEKIIGVVPGTKYVLRTGDSWYGVKADGTLAAVKTNPVEAADLAAPLTVAAPSVSAVKEITGLTNGKTYSVYLLEAVARTAGGTAAIVGTDTVGKHTIVNVSLIQPTYTITIATATGNAVGSSLVLLTDPDGLLNDNGGAVANYTRVKGTSGTGLTYQFSAVGGSAELKAVTAGDKYLVLDNMDDAFTATITPSAPVATTKLLAGSQGTEAAGKITVTANKYVVQNRGVWYSVAANGALTAQANVAVAAGLAETTGTEIAGVNDDFYGVYLVGELTDTGTIASGSGTVDTGGKSAIVNIGALATGKAVTLAAGGNGISANLIFLVDPSLTLTPRDGIANAGIVNNAIVATGAASTKKYTLTVTAPGAATSFAPIESGDKWFTLLGGTNAAINLVITVGTP